MAATAAITSVVFGVVSGFLLGWIFHSAWLSSQAVKKLERQREIREAVAEALKDERGAA